MRELLKPSEHIIREFPDRGTIWLLEVPENLQELIRLLERELAGRLDFTHAVRVNRSLVPDDLQKREMDIIYEVPFAEDGRHVLVYVLLEHQSDVEPRMGVRLLSYMIKLWEAQEREWKRGQTTPEKQLYTPVLPIRVLYGNKSVEFTAVAGGGDGCAQGLVRLRAAA